MEQGPTEQTIITACVRERRPLPAAIANAPELWLGLDLFYVAFLDLTSCRTLGMGEGPIPWTAVGQWCDEQGITGEQREDVRYHVSKLDTVYLEHRASKTAKQAKQPKAADGSPVVRTQNASHRGPRR